jgi:general stress protein 26
MESDSRKKLIEILKTFRNAMLVTHTVDKTLRSRPMALMRAEENGDVWFMTSFDSGKVDEIEMSPDVNVSMQEGHTFLSLSGRASISRDRAKIEELWTEHCKVYFPKGKNDPDIAIIKVSASEGEYWDNAGINRVKFLFETVKAYVKGTPPEIDTTQHGTVSLKGSNGGQSEAGQAHVTMGKHSVKHA